MEIKSNIKEFIKRLEVMKEKINSNIFQDGLFEVINTGMGDMKNRIFNRGEDAENKSLGKYVGGKSKLTKEKYRSTRYSIFGLSVRVDKEAERERKKQRKNSKAYLGQDLTSYEKFRISKGRQIEYKDLELEGDLRRSIQCIKSDDGKIVIIITNEKDANKAHWQEEQIQKIRGSVETVKIFAFSEKEFETIKNEGNAHIDQILKKIFK